MPDYRRLSAILILLGFVISISQPAQSQNPVQSWHVRVASVISYGEYSVDPMGKLEKSPDGQEAVTVDLAYNIPKKTPKTEEVWKMNTRFLDAAGNEVHKPMEATFWGGNVKRSPDGIEHFSFMLHIPKGATITAVEGNGVPLDISAAKRESVDVRAEIAEREARRKAAAAGGTGVITGRLLDESGNGVADAGVDLAILPAEEASGKKNKNAFLFLSYAGRTKTDAEGKFSFENLRANNYIMSVTDSKGRFVGMPVKSNNKDAVFVVGDQAKFDVLIRMNNKGLVREK